MKMKVKVFTLLVLMQCAFTQIAFGDIVVEKDIVEPSAAGALLFIAGGIAIIWVISMAVIRAVRNKNVGK